MNTNNGVGGSDARGVALVTGCSSGFGLHSAIELARVGYRVVASMRSLARRGALDDAAKQAGVALEVVALDVTDAAACEALVARIDPLEVLVNNAGIGLMGAIEDVGDDELRAIFDTNFFGAATLCRAAVPGMRRRRRGRIINVSSVGGRVGAPGLDGYNASKFALEGLSESMRYALRPFGVYVVLVEPGMFRTSMVAQATATRAAASPDSAYRAYTDFIQHTMRRVTAAADSPDPVHVGRAIARAATAPAPPLRIRVGRDAHVLLTLQRALPATAFEWVSMQIFARAIKSTPPRA